MQNELDDLVTRVDKLERQLKFWKLLALLPVFILALGFTESNISKEADLSKITVTSNDGRTKVILDPTGLRFVHKEKEIAALSMQTLGDSDELYGSLIFREPQGHKTELSAARLFIQASDSSHGSIQVHGARSKTTISPTGIEVPNARLGLSSLGVVALDMFHENNLIASIGAMGNFLASSPPIRNSAALLLNDFSADGKSHFITPSEDAVRGKVKSPDKK